MRSYFLRALGALTAAGVALVAVPTPAAAADPTTFRLGAGGFVSHGTYAHMMSIPEQPVPPIRITGTLSGRHWLRCAVLQVARSGPADGLEWQTYAHQCGRGRTDFRIQASYLFRGVNPPVRLCTGWTLTQAQRGRSCDLYRPPADR
ncbi:hypothetical protein AB0J83_15315 [Actinoplanes sp. NPDC049596]|uniref:hypothetical protein n=1 Tax=unclassified Actinoplanes TaxID=2626549 RepID=UPI00344844C8